MTTSEILASQDKLRDKFIYIIYFDNKRLSKEEFFTPLLSKI